MGRPRSANMFWELCEGWTMLLLHVRTLLPTSFMFLNGVHPGGPLVFVVIDISSVSTFSHNVGGCKRKEKKERKKRKGFRKDGVWYWGLCLCKGVCACERVTGGEQEQSCEWHDATHDYLLSAKLYQTFTMNSVWLLNSYRTSQQATGLVY